MPSLSCKSSQAVVQDKQAATVKGSALPKPAMEGKEVDHNLYYERRVAAVNHAKASGVNLYPHKFEVSVSLLVLVEQYKDLPVGTRLEDTMVSIAGRVYSKRASGTKLVFYDVQSDGVMIQVMSDIRFDPP